MGIHWNFPRHLANPSGLRTGSLFRQEKCAFDRSELCLFLIHVNHRFTLTICLKGASAVLIYGAMDSPLAQPRALVGGHFLGALTGISSSSDRGKISKPALARWITVMCNVSHCDAYT